ncbi:MAG TPA: isoleucine--tRNA ligase [Gemmatimonadota bacterium]|nr:isoleucine--tRNA ligase [Gemmatimonadota bacterium]
MSDATRQKDYKETLNLPRTSFPMRAGLPEREPETLSRWREQDLYGALRRQRAGRERWVLHDGPPYANGHIHLGHAVDKIQKDMIVRSRSMMGYDAPYVPGWDCHGMPIEINVQREFQERGEQPGLLELRRRCREYAAEWIDIQRREFRRLGGWGAWDDPYLTMSNQYEADIVETFADLVEDGYIYRGLRPIHWCTVCQTALAEAEIEYHEKESPSITVKLDLREDPGGVFGEGADAPGALIWTTTPWTIPANRAVVVHPDVEYAVVETDRGTLLYATERHEELAELFERSRIVRTVPGRELAGLVFTHPLEDRPSPLLLADHVSTEEGTGLVHTAPGHGAEDFAVGKAEGLEIYNPVGPDGIFLDGTPGFAGVHIWDANPRIVEDLERRGLLLERRAVSHSYPHCWRCQNPVVFRATVQWFLSLDHGDLRRRALEEIEAVRWIPPSTVNRISTMVEQRPDWCLSRQRAWGVGIPAVYCRRCEEPLLDAGFVRHVAALVRERGADAWFEEGVDAIVPDGVHCPRCGPDATSFRREIEILDVWFDSGTSQRAVLEARADLAWPADLYKEGPDQHRGWFNSSLILAVAGRDAAPYRTVLTHGWMVDAQGRAMHKSLGNVIGPSEVVESRGADILRLWTAANDFTRDGRFSWEGIDQVSEAYRRMRNTLRFLLGNLADFDPERDSLSEDSLEPFDRHALAELERTSEAVLHSVREFEFHVAYQRLVNYCTVDLSGIYLDGIKVRLYTRPAASRERRSAQTALHAVLDGLVRMLAPILPFTAEETWAAMAPRPVDESVHLLEYAPSRPERRDPDLEREWEVVLRARQAVTAELEKLREKKVIGSSLAARVEIAAASEVAQEVLRRRAVDLEEAFIVSAVRVHEASDEWKVEPVEHEEGFLVAAMPADGKKCQRCWRFRTDVGEAPTHPDLCAECAGIVG